MAERESQIEPVFLFCFVLFCSVNQVNHANQVNQGNQVNQANQDN